MFYIYKSQGIKNSVRIVRNINYNIGRQDFVVMLLCQLYCLSLLSDVLSEICDSAQLTICVLPQKKEG